MNHGWMDDARFAMRLLRKSPAFTVVAALSLAIGIGANAAIFSVASAALLRPLPGLSDPGRLVDIGRTRSGEGFDTVSYLEYQDIRARVTTLQDVYAYRLEPEAMSLAGLDGAERVYGSFATGNYFTTLGTRPHLGRLLRAEDDENDGAAVAVISHSLWQRRFGSAPGIAGTSITLNGRPYTVIGVAPPGFQGTTVLKSDVWLPVSQVAQSPNRINLLRSRGASWLVMGARLKPGATIAQADAELSVIGAGLEREHSRENRGRGYAVAASALVPGRIDIVAGFIAILMGLVGLVLLVACVNVSGMLLTRAAARQREIAVRLAIGAGRGRLIRQLLTETAVLFAAGACLGLPISTWLTSLLLSVLPQLPVPLSLEVAVDWRVVTFTTVVSLGAALLSGLAPALQASRADLAPALKSDALDGGSRMRLRSVFVVGQVTISIVLIVAAGLFLRALQRAGSIDPGFNPDDVDVVSLDLSLAGYGEDTGPAFVRSLLERVRALPHVAEASAARDLPLDDGRVSLGRVRVAGVELPPGRVSLVNDWNIVEPGYFRTLELPLTRGRDFTAADAPGSPAVAIVNDALARAAWPGQDPIGRQLQWEGIDGPSTLTVVGVTADAKAVSLNADTVPFIYVPLAQQYNSRTKLVIRTASGRSAIAQVRALVRSMDPNLPVTEALRMTEVTAFGLIPQRIAAAVAASLGVVALLLAAIGIFGVTSYAVSRRTREIGIRMALGADRASVKALVLRQGLTLAGVGIAFGVPLAAAGSKVIESLLFGVSGLDPLAFAGACVLFAGVTLAASYIPARRAMTVDPVVALRRE